MGNPILQRMSVLANVQDELSQLASGTKACSAGDVPEVAKPLGLAPSSCSLSSISSIDLPVQFETDGTEYVMHPTRGKLTKPKAENPHRLEFRPLQSECSPPTADPAAHGLSSTLQSESRLQEGQ